MKRKKNIVFAEIRLLYAFPSNQLVLCHMFQPENLVEMSEVFFARAFHSSANLTFANGLFKSSFTT